MTLILVWSIKGYTKLWTFVTCQYATNVTNHNGVQCDVLGSICFGKHTYPHFINGNLNGQWLPGGNSDTSCTVCWTPLSDNAHLHIARTCKDFLLTLGSPCPHCRPYSPDMSPINTFGMFWIGVSDSSFQFPRTAAKWLAGGMGEHLPGYDWQPVDVHVLPVYQSAWREWWTQAFEVCKLWPLTPIVFILSLLQDLNFGIDANYTTISHYIESSCASFRKWRAVVFIHLQSDKSKEWSYFKVSLSHPEGCKINL